MTDHISIALAAADGWNQDAAAQELAMRGLAERREKIIDQCAAAGLTRTAARERMVRPKWLPRPTPAATEQPPDDDKNLNIPTILDASGRAPKS